MQDLHHGKEIYLFFGIYGINGIIGIVISQIIIGIIVYKTLKISRENNIENYADFSKHINKEYKINEITKKIINIFLLLSFYVMIAGFSAYFSQELGIPNIVRDNNHNSIMLYNIQKKHWRNNKSKYSINTNFNNIYYNTSYQKRKCIWKCKR